MQALIARAQALYTRLRHIYWIRFLMDVFARFGRDNGYLLAAGLSFYLLLAFVPLLLVGLWFLGHLYANRPDEALHQIQANIIPKIVPNGGASREVLRFMTQAHIASPDGQHAGPALLRLLRGHGVAGTLGILTTVWAAIQIFVNGSTAMNAAWETQEKRSWIVLRAIALGLLIGTGILVLFSLGATAVSAAVSNTQLAHGIPFEGLLFSMLAELVAVVFSVAMYTVIFRFLPSASVSWKAALAGGIFAGVTGEIVKKALAAYLLKPNTSLYGDLGNLIVFILWVWYSMTILLMGAEVSALYSREKEASQSGRLKAVATPAGSRNPGLGGGRPANAPRPRPRRSRGASGRGGPHAKR